MDPFRGRVKWNDHKASTTHKKLKEKAKRANESEVNDGNPKKKSKRQASMIAFMPRKGTSSSTNKITISTKLKIHYQHKNYHPNNLIQPKITCSVKVYMMISRSQLFHPECPISKNMHLLVALQPIKYSSLVVIIMCTANILMVKE